MIGIDRRWSRLEKQFRAANGFGRLICWGLMTPRECFDALLSAAAEVSGSPQKSCTDSTCLVSASSLASISS